MRLNAIAAGLMLALAHAANAEPAPPSRAALNVSGGMTANADGTASFEFRVANERADTTITGFTVTVAFYDRTVAPNRKLADYHWSFVSEVPPNGILLEYGVLDAKAVAELKGRHTAAAAGPLATAVYTYEGKIDGEAAAPNN
jgi:hypothetical protein